VNPWSTLGWYSPNRHAADIVVLRAEFVTATEKSKKETEEFRVEWRCSEWAEDLLELYEQRAAGDDSESLRDKIEDLRDKMNEAGCDKYEDY